jgi:hypothetical protein
VTALARPDTPGADVTGRSGADAGFSPAVSAGWSGVFAGDDVGAPTTADWSARLSGRDLLVFGAGSPGVGARSGGGETDALARAAVGGLGVVGAGAADL